ncbi:hypothetical protein A9Q84_11115 [Halobacteriovorax marinus]|uniref:EF-hand domain-containing protein n=1 Tax=Halobacteriovorax marinus TaxID=97084 RepID=A0A1Y5FD40_9BACT|nr:hypothetical protein A9Q84_11115 [Halobacteriovorax marinus]
MEKFKVYLFILILALVSSCGFTDDEPVKDQDTFISNELGSTCELDPEQFGNILDTNIEAHIKCLEENFIQFSRYVRTNTRTTISEGELSNFIRVFFNENTDTIIQGLKLIFEVNMLLLRDEANSINRNNITPFFRLLVTVNKEAIIITRTLREMQEEEESEKLFKLRKILKDSLERFSKTSLTIIQKPGTLSKVINLKKFLLSLNDRIDMGDANIDEKLVNALLFIKKLFLGGEKDQLTSAEIELAIHKIPNLLLMATDFTVVKETHFKNKNSYYVFQQNIIKRFRKMLFPIKETDSLFEMEDLYVITDRMNSQDDSFDLRKYEKIFSSVKKDLIGGDPEVFTFKEFKHLLSYIEVFIEGLKMHESHLQLTEGINSKTIEEKELIKVEYLNFVRKHAKNTKRIVRKNGGFPQRVDILTFVKTLSTEIDEFDFKVDFIDAIFGLKVMISGGEKNLLSLAELCDALDKSSALASMLFDFKYLNNSYEEDSSKKWNFLAEALAPIFPILNTEDSLVAMSLADIKVILTELFLEETESKELGGVQLSLEEIDSFVLALKEHIFTTSPDVISVGEISSLLKLSQIGMKALEFIQLYDELKELSKDHQTELPKFLEMIEAKAKSLEVMVQRELPTLKYINKSIDYFELVKTIAPLLVEEDEDKIAKSEKKKKKMSIKDIVDNIRPFKTLLFGGERTFLTFSEIKAFSYKISSYAKALFEIQNTDLEEEQTNERRWSVFLKNFIPIKKNLVFDQSIDYFEANEMMSSINWFLNFDVAVEDRIDYTKFASTVINFKGRVLHQRRSPQFDPSTDPDIANFESNQIQSFVEYAHEALEVLSFNEKTYIQFERELAVRSKITHLNLYRYSNYPLIRGNSIYSLRKDFLHMAKTYRHYTEEVERKDDEGNPLTRYVQYFGRDIKRTKFGFVQSSIIRFALKKVLLGYSKKLNHQDVVDLEMMNMLLMDFKPVLQELNLWSHDFKTFSENTILLGDLFQNTSDGDNAINLDEGVEYANMVMVAVSLGDEIMLELKEDCTNLGDPDELAFSPGCYRPHFLDSWINRLGYQGTFPKLSRYLKETPTHEVIDFVRKTEGFARDYDDPNLPMNIRDYTLLIGAMLNIESTFVRFDVNNDNIIGNRELEDAFKIYESSIVQLAELGGWKKMFSKTVFFFMVKFKKIPTNTEVMTHHFNLNANPFYDDTIEAKRLNIGALLYNLIQYRSNTP